ncbi:MAG: hypothetical protein WCK28_13160 [Burkholderiales bacterium]|jgi:hypothetical protein
MAAVWDETTTTAETRTDSPATKPISFGARPDPVFGGTPLGLADVDGRIERFLARLDGDDPFGPEADDEATAPAERAAPPDVADLQRRLEDTIVMQRQQMQAMRDELAAQRTDLRRWLHDGLGAIQARVDRAAAREPAPDPRIAAAMHGLASCREDLDGVVVAVRSLSLGQREQVDALSNASVAANLRLREDLERDLREARIESERRLERLERTIVRRVERQRRFAILVAVGLGVTQLAATGLILALH